MTVDREKKIAEIREALEKATPGPWHMSKLSAGYLVDDRGKDITVFIEYNEDGSVHMEFENWQNNARLIANAPEWLGFLLDELERLEREYAEERGKENRKLREERDEARSKAEEAWKEIDSLEDQLLSSQQEIEQLREERDKLIEGLQWYADEIKYMNWPSELWINQGQRARDILKEIGVLSK
jgi:DNA repair exonuclease SbcCD ATPase subunit